jgi:hypothetical protein
VNGAVGAGGVLFASAPVAAANNAKARSVGGAEQQGAGAPYVSLGGERALYSPFAGGGGDRTMYALAASPTAFTGGGGAPVAVGSDSLLSEAY